MPAFIVDFTTERGPERRRFTLDQERPLAVQLSQVLEELLREDLVLTGGAADELVASWNGRDLDAARSPAALGITPERPIELRMRRPRAVPSAPVPIPEPEVDRLPSRGVYAGAVVGLAGAWAAWALLGAMVELGSVVHSYARLDLVAGSALGASVGAAVLGADAGRRARSWVMPLLVGALLGLIGGIYGASLGTLLVGRMATGPAAAAGVLQRLVGWSALGAGIGALVGLGRWEADRRAVLDGLLCGLFGGAAAGGVSSLPGAADFWGALAFGVLGAATGGGLGLLPFRRAHAMIELERRGGAAVTLLGLREWSMSPGDTLALPGVDGSVVARIRSRGRGFALHEASADPSRPPVAGGELRTGDRIRIGGDLYRFRRCGGGEE